jgi:hypothetical protein
MTMNPQEPDMEQRTELREANTTPPPTREERLAHGDELDREPPDEPKPADWCECYGCTTMRHPCIKDGDKHG